LWIKELIAEDIYKEMFPVRMGSVYHEQRFTTGWQIFADDEEVETKGRN
jgi:hypothetical protein